MEIRDSRLRWPAKSNRVDSLVYFGAYKEVDVYGYVDDKGKLDNIVVRWGVGEDKFMSVMAGLYTFETFFAAVQEKFGVDYEDAVRTLVKLFAPEETNEPE